MFDPYNKNICCASYKYTYHVYRGHINITVIPPLELWAPPYRRPLHDITSNQPDQPAHISIWSKSTLFTRPSIYYVTDKCRLWSDSQEVQADLRLCWSQNLLRFFVFFTQQAYFLKILTGIIKPSNNMCLDEEIRKFIALTALLGWLSLGIPWRNGPEWGLQTVSFNL